jgi:hypothetical protein
MPQQRRCRHCRHAGLIAANTLTLFTFLFAAFHFRFRLRRIFGHYDTPPIFIIADELHGHFSLRCAAAAAAMLIDAITPMPYYFPAPLRRFRLLLIDAFRCQPCQAPRAPPLRSCQRRIAA